METRYVSKERGSRLVVTGEDVREVFEEEKVRGSNLYLNLIDGKMVVLRIFDLSEYFAIKFSANLESAPQSEARIGHFRLAEEDAKERLNLRNQFMEEGGFVAMPFQNTFMEGFSYTVSTPQVQDVKGLIRLAGSEELATAGGRIR